MATTYYSNGKLLITGEYAVLDGAKALAFPTKAGQYIIIEEIKDNIIYWESYDHKGETWFKTELAVRDKSLSSLKLITETSKAEAVLINILETAITLNPDFLNVQKGFKVTTRLDFPREWGLGTSSTLINNIAQWAGVDPFELLSNSFGGSGYDIAAAKHSSPLLYTLTNKAPHIEEVSVTWPFINHLFFVYLNQKQDSKEGIKRYKTFSKTKTIDTRIFSEIATQLLRCTSIATFSQLLNQHEQLISKIIETPTIKELLFSDYEKTIKSLGAWGGDFILVVGDDADKDYFRSKNYTTIIPFQKMVL